MSDMIERGIEQRKFSITDIEVRANKNGMVTLAGYASTFNQPYAVRDRWGEFDETVQPGTWTDTIADRSNKIHLLIGHGQNPIPLASNRVNLRLSEDARGLPWEADLNPTRSQLHGDIAYAVEAGIMDEMSVGMNVVADRWNEAQTERSISQADLIEISLVSRGANPNTSAATRSEDILAEIRHLQGMLLERGEQTDTTERHLHGLYEEMARLNRRRYI